MTRAIDEKRVGVATKDAQAAVSTTEATKWITDVLGAVQGTGGGEVSIKVPSPSVMKRESSRRNLLDDASNEGGLKRRALAQALRSVRRVASRAKEKGVSLQEAATELGERSRRIAEESWVSLRADHHELRSTVMAMSRMFSNLRTSREIIRRRCYALPISTSDLVSDEGLEAFERHLSRFIDMPDSRPARRYVIAPGWVGSVEALDRLNEVTHRARAFLVTDLPRFADLEELETEASEGGVLERLPGTEVHKRHVMLFGGRVRAEPRFVGRYAEDAEDLFVPASVVWSGAALDRLTRGKVTLPPVGYFNPLEGVDGVDLELRLRRGSEGHALYSQWSTNPLIRLAAGSDQIVVWGAYTLGGIQIGEAFAELESVHFFERMINKYGLFQDLETAREEVQRRVSKFVADNSGVGRMFAANSRAEVTVDADANCLIVVANLAYRTLATKAMVRLQKPRDVTKQGVVSVS